MSRHRQSLIVLLMSASLAAPLHAAGKDCEQNPQSAPAEVKPPSSMPKMTVEMPMTTEMAKPGSMAMDVSGAAAAKDDCMRPMLDKEQGMMDAKKAEQR